MVDQIHIKVTRLAIEKTAGGVVWFQYRKQRAGLGDAEFRQTARFGQEIIGFVSLPLGLQKQRATRREQWRIGEAAGRLTEKIMACAGQSQHRHRAIIGFIACG